MHLTSLKEMHKAEPVSSGHFFMSNGVETPPNNGAVFIISQIIKAVMS